jgi:MFS family permease
MVPVLIGIAALGIGFVAAGLAPSLLTFAVAQCLLIGALGNAATFVPLVADTSMWFTRRRGIAVAICASGNYLAGAVWPPILQHYFDIVGWRQTFIGVGIFSVVAMAPLAFALRRRAPALSAAAPAKRLTQRSDQPLAFRRGRCRRSCALRVSPAAWRWRCRRSISSPTAATSGSGRHAARKCSR